MLKFSEFLEESYTINLHSFLLEKYEELNEVIAGFDKDAEKTSHKGIASALEAHVDAHYKKSDTEQKAAKATAKKYFKETDLRTEEEKSYGEEYAKKRAEHNAKPENKKNQMEESIFEKPIKFNGSITTSTNKHKMHGKDYQIPRGEHAGKGAHVAGVRLTPGSANLGHGKILRTCPAATAGCEGSEGDRKESGVKKGALCLAAEKGLDVTRNSKADKLARTRALAHPDHQKHAAALVAGDLENLHKGAEKDNSVAMLRQRDSSDIDLLNGIRKKHFGDHPTYMKGKKANARMEGYGYSKYADDKSELGSHDDSSKEHKGEEKIYRSDTGPEHDRNGMPVPGQHARKEKTIQHLTGGKHARAYLVAGRVRDKATKGTDEDSIKDIHTVRYHRYDEHGNHIGHEDFDADRNDEHGDLHMFGKQAERNTHTADGKEKGAVTITDISGGNKRDIESNSMVHPIDADHVTHDPDHPGKKILHVDPPHLKKKVINIGVK